MYWFYNDVYFFILYPTSLIEAVKMFQYQTLMVVTGRKMCIVGVSQ